MRRTMLLLVMSLVMLAAEVTTALSAASRCPNPMFRLDAAGDVGSAGGGADITAVGVDCTSSTVRFRVTFAKAPPLLPSDQMLIIIDVPPAAASPYGRAFSDYTLAVRGTQSTGTVTSVTKPRWSFPVLTARSAVSFSINRKKLGNPASFRFIVAMHRYQGDAVMAYVDTAPDRETQGTFSYRFPK